MDKMHYFLANNHAPLEEVMVIWQPCSCLNGAPRSRLNVALIAGAEMRNQPRHRWSDDSDRRSSQRQQHHHRARLYDRRVALQRSSFSGRGGRGTQFRRSDANEPRVHSAVQIFVENLPEDVMVAFLVEHFSVAGQIKVDRGTNTPRVWLYHDEQTGRPKGECTITFVNAEAQQNAIKMFDGSFLNGRQLRVTPSLVKSHMANPALQRSPSNSQSLRNSARPWPAPSNRDRQSSGRFLSTSRTPFV